MAGGASSGLEGWKERWTVIVDWGGTVNCSVSLPGLLEIEETLEAEELVAIVSPAHKGRTYIHHQPSRTGSDSLNHSRQPHPPPVPIDSSIQTT